jgi:RNA polymerase sigma-70 factor (ECF subfamily)
VAREFPAITTLIPDLKDGDEASWNSLVELFTPGLSGKAFVLLRESKLRHKLAPEDLVNETLIKAWKHHRLIRGQSTFQIAKWLLTIMVNSFRDHCRKGGLPEETQPEWDSPVDRAALPSSNVESFEQEVRLHAVIAELEEGDREILLLKYWHGLTHEQIAEKIGTSKASVTRHVQKLLPKLNQAMQDG